MKKNCLYVLICLVLFAFAACADSGGFGFGAKSGTETPLVIRELSDVTAKVVKLGNPLNVQYPDDTEFVYARNIHDLQVFNGKIYLANGAYDNKPPAANAGPVYIWSYSPVEGFKNEFKTTDEAILRFRVFDGELYAPGVDTRYGNNVGSFYRLEKDGWKNHRTINAGDRKSTRLNSSH